MTCLSSEICTNMVFDLLHSAVILKISITFMFGTVFFVAILCANMGSAEVVIIVIDEVLRLVMAVVLIGC